MMANLQLAVNGEYFDQMKRGEKTEEYRLVNPYWGRRIHGKDYDRLIITRGYPKREDASRRIDSPYGGPFCTFRNCKFKCRVGWKCK